MVKTSNPEAPPFRLPVRPPIQIQLTSVMTTFVFRSKVDKGGLLMSLLLHSFYLSGSGNSTVPPVQQNLNKLFDQYRGGNIPKIL